MKNREIADLFGKISEIPGFKGENPFKIMDDEPRGRRGKTGLD
jgi:hypothetical protein